MPHNIHWLTVPELKAVLKKVPGPRHALMVLMHFWHGLRDSEVITLRGKHIQARHVSLKRVKGSRPCHQPWLQYEDPDLDEYTLLGLASQVCDHCGVSQLDEIAGPIECQGHEEHKWRDIKPTERLFPMYSDEPEYVKDKKTGKDKKLGSVKGRFSYYRMFYRAAEKAGLPPHKRHPHVLKHTCGMVSVADGVNYAQARLGHTSLSSTSPYTQISQERSNKAFTKTAQRLEALLEE
jgi:integrase